MAVNRPGFKPSVKANLDVTAKKTNFVDIKEGARMRLRFLPAGREDGVFLVPNTNHFKVKIDGRSAAAACLEVHGTEATGTRCAYCEASRWFKKNGDKGEQKIAEDIKASTKHYAQVLVAEKQEDGTFKYIGPKLFGISPAGARNIMQIMSNMEIDNEPFFTDPDEGQDLIIKREGKGFDTKYPVDRTGHRVSLDTIFPEWVDKFIPDVLAELGLRLQTYEEQRKTLLASYAEELDWEAFNESLRG